uniref:RanBD1 domain-containing protein n=1 Tax=Rhabditophanes sp. KR3021 TaxID=114890 RepID=A0AC35UII2_9BILA
MSVAKSPDANLHSSQTSSANNSDDNNGNEETTKIENFLETMKKLATPESKSTAAPAPKFVFGQSLFKSKLQYELPLAKTDNKSSELSSKSIPTTIFGQSCVFELKIGMTESQNHLSASDILTQLAKSSSNVVPITKNDNASESEKKDFGTLDLGLDGKQEAFLSVKENSSLEDVEMTTGEEKETNIFHMNFQKMHRYDASTKTWLERGAGEIRVNRIENEEEGYQYRIISRVGGNRRVLINSGTFEGMYCEQTSKTRVKFTALAPESEVPNIFLVSGNATLINKFCEVMENHLNARVCYLDEAIVNVRETRSLGERKRPAEANEDEEGSSVTAVKKTA